LRDSEEQLRFALEGNRDGFFDWNMETGHLVYSSAYAEILGYKAEELEPSLNAWKSLLHPEDKPSVFKALQDHLEGRTDFYESEHRLRTKSGDYLWVHARSRVTKRDHDGKPLRVNGTHHDISGRKRLEEELRSTREGLEKRVAERTIELQEANIAMKVLLKKQVKPGLTCLWQCAPCRNEISFQDWMRMDLEYIDNWSLKLDFGILVKTAAVVLLGSGR
jgi:PAS domain S-box-containing protein